jgi:trimeric autotransporter adhesin
MKTMARLLPILLTFALVCFALVQKAQAVVPPPDGGYPGGNTAEGTAALLSLGPNGFNNTAIGFLSLKNTTQGDANTAVGAGALFSNRGQGQNTATGAGALFNSNGENNTANGAFALYTNSIGSGNTAVGSNALYNNTVTYANTAIGYGALFNNGGDFGTAGGNTAIGFEALYNNTTGNSNIAVGSNAGFAVTTSSNVLCIGTQGANVDDSCYIANIWQQPGGSQQVFVNADGKLGAQVSSRRFKDEIKPMEQSSEVIYKLRPVSFRYKPVIDPSRPSGFGLIAEDVDAVASDLVLRDKEGKPYTVRYDAVNAMLLNEFLKEHQAFVEEQRKVERLEKQVAALTAGLQKVSAELETNRAAPQTVRVSAVALRERKNNQ